MKSILNTKKLAFLAILMAIHIVLQLFKIPVGNNLNIYLTFLIMMLVASSFELPVVIIYAGVYDIISFFLFPEGNFMIEYTLVTILGAIIYHLFLYKKINILTVSLSKFSVNLICNVLLESAITTHYWGAEKGYMYYVSASTIKNLIMLPIEIALFMVFINLLKPLYTKYLRTENIPDNFFKLK